MCTSLLYHGFGIRGHEYVRTRYQRGEVEFTIKQDPQSLSCPVYGSRDVLKGTRWLLLKNPENLDPNKNAQERLQEALNLKQPLSTVYYTI